MDSQKLSRFEALLKQLENGKGTLQFLLNKEQVRYIKQFYFADGGQSIRKFGKISDFPSPIHVL
jgi:hypothetical protein